MTQPCSMLAYSSPGLAAAPYTSVQRRYRPPENPTPLTKTSTAHQRHGAKPHHLIRIGRNCIAKEFLDAAIVSSVNILVTVNVTD